MSDIFREVDEDVRSDRLSEFWAKYSFVVYGLALAIVLGTTAFVILRHQKQTAAEQAGARFEAAQLLSLQKKPEAAAAAFDALAKNAPQGYKALAALRAAEEKSGSDRAAAVKELDLLAADASLGQLLQDAARLRAAMLRVDEADKGELEQRFGPLLNGAFRYTAREYLALAAMKRGDFEDAGKLLDQIVVDPNASQTIRQRAEAFLSLVRGGGKFVPPAKPPGAAKSEPGKSEPGKPAPADTPAKPEDKK
jgi:hypothetical protein